MEAVGVDVGFGRSESFPAGELGFEPGGLFFHTQVVDRVVLIVQDHRVEREGGFECADGVSAEGSGVSGLRAGLA